MESTLLQTGLHSKILASLRLCVRPGAPELTLRIPSYTAFLQNAVIVSVLNSQGCTLGWYAFPPWGRLADHSS
jgi:hypothetical protein